MLGLSLPVVQGHLVDPVIAISRVYGWLWPLTILQVR